MRCWWHSYLLNGLASIMAAIMSTHLAYAGEAAPTQVMTVAQFLAELQAERQGNATPPSTAATNPASVAEQVDKGAGLASEQPPAAGPDSPVVAPVSAPTIPASTVPASAFMPSGGDAGDAALQPVRASERISNETADGPYRPAEITSAITAGGADDSTLLDLSAVVRQAESSHPSIARSLGNLYATLEEIDVARAGYYPRVSTALGSGYSRSNSRPWDSLNISASQMLYDFGKVSSSVDVAASGADRNRASVLQTMDDLASDTAGAFIEVQRYQALLDIAREQTRAIGEIQDLAEKRSALGASSRSDSLQALSRHEAALATELQLQAQLDLWKRTLQNYTGREVGGAVDGGFPEQMAQACLNAEEDFSEVPSVLVAEAALEQARAKIERAHADYFPTFSLSANYGNVNNPANAAFNSTLDDREFSLALSVDSTLFQGGATRARRRAAEYSVQAAQAGREEALREVGRSFREARDQTRSFLERLNYLDARHDNVVNTQALYRQQYLSLGTRTLLDILNTEQEIHQALFDTQQTVHDLRRMQIDCLHSTGGLRDAFGIDSRPARGIRVRQ